MISTNRYIIADAVYRTMIKLLSDVDYCTSINSYVYKLGLKQYQYTLPEIIEDVEQDRLLLSQNPNVYPFLYNGSFEELVRLYNTANSYDVTLSGDTTLPLNVNKYLGIWNLLPKKIEHKNGRTFLDTEIHFICNVDREWTTEQRDKILFEPIFDKIKNTFIKELENYPFLVHNSYGIDYNESRGYNVFGLYSDEIGDYVSVLKIEFEIEIVDTVCEKYYNKVLENANRLYEILTLN